MERNDVYQDEYFVSEMDHILRKVFYYRNLALFVPLMERFSPLYLNYLYGFSALLTSRSYVPEDLMRKELPSLLYSLLLSYPMSRSLLRELVPSLNAFLGAVKLFLLLCFPLERCERGKSKRSTTDCVSTSATCTPTCSSATPTLFSLPAS